MATMTASEVKEALTGRWPASEYLSIYEAPQSSDRQGRRLDVVVVSLWRSRGLQMDGVEIKVSMSDWKRELDEPAKADWWHQRVHRFWIAAPAEVAKKIKPQLPVNWGLLSVTASGVRVSVTPEPNRSPVPLTWPETVGLLRATADCGVNVLARQYEKGVADGLERGRKEAANGTVDGQERRRADLAVADLEAFRAAVREFEEASGIKLDRWGRQNARLGRLVKLVNEAILQGPETIADRLAGQAEQLRSIADVTDRLHGALGSAFAEESTSPTLDFADGDDR